MLVDISERPIAKTRNEKEGKTRQLQKKWGILNKNSNSYFSVCNQTLLCLLCDLSNVIEVQSPSLSLHVLGLIALFTIMMNRGNKYRASSTELCKQWVVIKQWLSLSQTTLSFSIKILFQGYWSVPFHWLVHFYSNISKQI